jgi:two-component system LytT family response regulator
MFRCIIIDDEKNAQEFLEGLLEKYFREKALVVKSCGSIIEGVEAINKYNPEVVFLDIQLKGEKGFDLFRFFENVNFTVIFTTAHEGYAIEAIKHSAHDYLLKPINRIDLFEAFQRLTKKIKKESLIPDIAGFIDNFNFDPYRFEKIALPTEKGFVLENLKSILYCEAQSNYVKIHTIDGRSILVSKTLKAVEEMLPKESYFRIHKSFLVNLNFIFQYDKSMGFFVEMSNSIKLPVSVRNNTALINAITKSKN